jgi:tetratricopeptide (TPR) repeat protein
MPRVVCPICKTGFEASITPDNVAVNCVSCGVAFNASPFLPNGSSANVGVWATPRGQQLSQDSGHYASASPSTRTAGLAFMNESGTHAPLRRASPPVELTPLPKPVTPRAEASQSAPSGASGRAAVLVCDDDDAPAESGPREETKPTPCAPAESAASAVAAADDDALKSSAESATTSDESDEAQNAPKDPSVQIMLEKCAAECPSLPDAPRNVRMVTVLPPEGAHDPVALGPVAPGHVDEKRALGTKKTGRRPLLEGAFGPYDIQGEIARGGVGAVFRAKDRESGRNVALKVLLDGPEAGEAECERFRHECETAKALSLPGMVQVYAVGTIDGRPYMAMELIEGRSLDRIIPEKSLCVHECLVLMKSVAETIGALHESGYVHRDLKPGNILLDAFGSPKVADFGLVKSLDEVTRLTAAGLVCGTPAYMAPEQARGDGKAVDPRSDVWALGAVLYEMLAGRPPFQAENALRLMLRITKEPPRPPREINLKVPADVQAIVLKCLEKSAERRYANARMLAVDIGHFLNGEPVEAAIQGREKFTRLFTVATQNRRAMRALGIAAAVVVAVALLVRMAFGPKDAGPLIERGYAALMDNSLQPAQRMDRAEKYFAEAASVDPKNPRAQLGLGLVLGRESVDPQTRNVDRKLFSQALAATFRAAELDPALQADAHAQAAKFYLWMKSHTEEVRELERAVEFSNSNLRLREALGMAYWNAGAQTGNSAYFKRAEVEFRNILQSDPSYPKVRSYILTLREQFLVPAQTQRAITANR